MRKTTKMIVAAILLAAVAVAMLFCWLYFAPKINPGEKTLSISITHGDGTEKDLTLRTDAEYLWDAMDEEGLIEGTDGDYGKWITAVDGETADEANGQYWMFTKGGEWVEYSCDQTVIADGESYEFFIYEYQA